MLSHKHGYSIRLIIGCMISLAVLLCAYGIGSASITMGDAYRVLMHKLFGVGIPERINPSQVSILWSIRLPRVLMAFFVGGALSVSGAVMQSVLQNPLASSYTLGVSSGASLGAALALTLFGQIPFWGSLMLPVSGAGSPLVTSVRGTMEVVMAAMVLSAPIQAEMISVPPK